MKAQTFKQFLALFIHFKGLILARKQYASAVYIKIKRRIFLHYKRIRGYMLNARARGRLYGLEEVLRALLRQTVHKIGIYVCKPRGFRKLNAFYKIIRRMYSAKSLKYMRRCALQTHRQPVYAALAIFFKLFGIYRARVGLDGYFCIRRYIVAFVQRLHYAGHLAKFKRTRSAPAYKHGAVSPGGHFLCRDCHFLY